MSISSTTNRVFTWLLERGQDKNQDYQFNLIFTAESDNTGDIVIGDSTVVAAAATRRGVPLVPGASYTIKIEDLYQLWIDADVSSDGVVFVYHF
ncbi:MAG: hypothetical protein UW01_C0022G0009 [Candidatus Nomurabacteria bacterium GW2011_GWA2_43_66]|nr:MAG: hypothetical protein UW01_C0022G0009 [Candidatus Nomurabacteria bacterium GW2011_GWA2_43_66]